MTDKGPDVVIQGPWVHGLITIDGVPLTWPVTKVAWEMAGGENSGAIPILKLEIECSRIRIEQSWPAS